jgi:Protein of unknown function (DUF1706)
MLYGVPVRALCPGRPYMPQKSDLRKEQLLSDLHSARLALLAAAGSVPGRRRDDVFLGTWSIKDLVAHLVGWDLANLEGVQAVLAGRLPEFYAHHDRDWAGLNAEFVARHKRNHYSALVAEARRAHRRLMKSLLVVPAEEFDRDFGVRFRGVKVTIARLLASETGDEQEHCRQVEEFARRIA